MEVKKTIKIVFLVILSIVLLSVIIIGARYYQLKNYKSITYFYNGQEKTVKIKHLSIKKEFVNTKISDGTQKQLLYVEVDFQYKGRFYEQYQGAPDNHRDVRNDLLGRIKLAWQKKFNPVLDWGRLYLVYDGDRLIDFKADLYCNYFQMVAVPLKRIGGIDSSYYISSSFNNSKSPAEKSSNSPTIDLDIPGMYSDQKLDGVKLYFGRLTIDQVAGFNIDQAPVVSHNEIYNRYKNFGGYACGVSL